jgi:Flp pilus assembly pilin Flp
VPAQAGLFELTWGGKKMQKLYEEFTVALGRAMTLSWDDLKRQEGQGATEYGLLIAFVVLSIALTVGLLGTAITGFLGRVAGKLNALVP